MNIFDKPELEIKGTYIFEYFGSVFKGKVIEITDKTILIHNIDDDVFFRQMKDNEFKIVEVVESGVDYVKRQLNNKSETKRLIKSYEDDLFELRVIDANISVPNTELKQAIQELETKIEKLKQQK